MTRLMNQTVLAIVLASLVAACSSGESLTPSRSPVIPQGAAHVGPSTTGNCASLPIKGLQVSTTDLGTLTSIGATTSFTACTQYFSKYTLSASPSGIVSVPSTVTPTQPTGVGWFASITVTAVAQGTATITVTDKKGNHASVSVTVAVHGSQTLDYTGTEQDFTAPAGVTQLTITALGAEGGALSICGGTAGYGASVTGTVSVTSDETLYVYVGGSGGAHNGFNGGGDPFPGSGTAGGGASDVRTSNTAALTGNASTDPRIIVAGGGGAIGCFPGSNGGNGGAAGGSGAAGANADFGATGGGGGTQSTAGAGGAGCLSPGGNGAAGNGGEAIGNGGNAGGGWFGGGGGGQGGSNNCIPPSTNGNRAGGGGGSSFVESTATNVSSTAGGNTTLADGQVKISW